MQSISSTMGQLAIVELSPPYEKLEIQFMPAGLSWSRSPDLPALAIVGRNNPHYHLTGGEDRLNFRLDFATELESRQDVIRKVMWLRSLTYNDGSTGKVRNVKLVWGQLFKKEIWVVTSVKADMDQFMPNANMLPQQAYVDITLALDPKKTSAFAMYDASQPLRLNDENPYAGGELLVRDDDTAELYATRPTYLPGPGDRFHPALLPGQMLDQLAWQYYQDEVENAERWWWVIADSNNIDNPLDLSGYVGKRLLIPDLGRYRLLANAQN